MSDWTQRLTNNLEPILRQEDPRPHISAYHDMPYAIFQYPAEAEFLVRAEVDLLQTRLNQAGKNVTVISLSECLFAALEAEGLSPEDLVEAERSVGLDATVRTVHEILSDYQPLDETIAARMPEQSDPLSDVVLIVRAGALFGVYRTFALPEQIKGRASVPSILFYPGDREGAAGLRFMGVLEAEHNYRARIF